MARVKIYHDGTWSVSELRRMELGVFIDRNGSRYAMCDDCKTVVRIDKPIIGSTHYCIPPSER
jgi:hypothetical protein